MPYAHSVGKQLAQKSLQIQTTLFSFYVQSHMLQKAFHLLYANSVFSQWETQLSLSQMF